MKAEQDTLNEIALEQLKIIHEKEEIEPIKQFAENMIYRVENANSNVSYEQANKLLEYNGDATIKFDEIIVFINKKIWKYGKCISKNIFKCHKDWFSKDDKRGEYRKIDAIIAANKLIE